MVKKVLVGLSGGVDSAVSAYLLKEKGYEVSAGFMINYLTDDDSCPTRIDMQMAQQVAHFLDIPFFTFDFREEYEKRVLDYLVSGYASGITPNPDVFCNTWIKFDLFRKEALSYGYDLVATGHYARIENDARGTYCLLRGVDMTKDQSYFLGALHSDQLQQTLFPLGDLLKTHVRQIARDIGLPNAERKDSQGLCFIGKVDFSEFLKQHIPQKKGPILDTHGKCIGEHDGAFQYTLGQRKGIAVGGGPALYVVAKDIDKNSITVGYEDDPNLFCSQCLLRSVNWLEEKPLPFCCLVQIRYRQTPQRCFVQRNTQGDLELVFEEPQRAVTPGQVAVLYQGDQVLGSGIIGLR